jgi:hypothetical protein
LTQLLDSSFNIENPAKESLVRWKFFDEFHHDQSVTYAALNDECQLVSLHQLSA